MALVIAGISGKDEVYLRIQNTVSEKVSYVMLNDHDALVLAGGIIAAVNQNHAKNIKVAENVGYDRCMNDQYSPEVVDRREER